MSGGAHTALKPCPFCGGKAGDWPDCRALGGYEVACLDCGAALHGDEPQLARDLWNTRTPDPELVKALEDLVGQVSQDGELWAEIEGLLKRARFPVAPLKKAVAKATAAIARARGGEVGRG